MSYLSTRDFLDDKDFVDRWQYTLRTGELDLSWMQAATEPVRCTPQNERRGLTFRDLDVPGYGFSAMPEVARANRSFAPRGAEIPPGCPDLQAEVNRKSEVWAYNIEGYYEEAMSRQWNATTDVPWAELAKVELPDDIAKAYAQLLTFLTEVEMIATDVPAKWMGHLNADFFEVKNFISTQVMDEARHAEVFRKRALTTGWGLMRASPQNELNLMAQIPDMFHTQKEYCFRAMEQDAFPRFLRSKAFGNLTPVSALVRLVVGLIVLWIGLAVGFSLIFLDVQPKSKRFFVSAFSLLCSDSY